MLNRRKAFVGYLVYTAAKPLIRRAIRSKTRGALPRSGERKLPRFAGLAGAAGLLGAVMFWRSRRSGGGEQSPET